MGHGSRDTGYGTQETGHGIRDTGDGTRDTRHGTRETGHRTRDMGHGTRDTGHGGAFSAAERQKQEDTGLVQAFPQGLLAHNFASTHTRHKHETRLPGWKVP